MLTRWVFSWTCCKLTSLFLLVNFFLHVASSLFNGAFVFLSHFVFSLFPLLVSCHLYFAASGSSFQTYLYHITHFVNNVMYLFCILRAQVCIFFLKTLAVKSMKILAIFMKFITSKSSQKEHEMKLTRSSRTRFIRLFVLLAKAARRASEAHAVLHVLGWVGLWPVLLLVIGPASGTVCRSLCGILLSSMTVLLLEGSFRVIMALKLRGLTCISVTGINFT